MRHRLLGQRRLLLHFSFARVLCLHPLLLPIAKPPSVTAHILPAGRRTTKSRRSNLERSRSSAVPSKGTISPLARTLRSRLRRI